MSRAPAPAESMAAVQLSDHPSSDPRPKENVGHVSLLELLIIVLCISAITVLSWILRNWLGMSGTGGLVWRAVRMTITYIGFPFIWLRWRGVSHRPWRDWFKGGLRAGPWAAAVYAAPLIVFIHLTGTPAFDRVFGGAQRLSLGEVVVMAMILGYMAVLTDWWVRGFLLSQLINHYPTSHALALTGTYWLLLHLYEIRLLAPSLGWLPAVLLTVFIGVGGDLVAVRHRNWTALGAGHTMFNWIYIAWLRF